MRAHLARHVARRVLLPSRSPSCASYASPALRRRLPVPIVHAPSYRTIFDGLFQKAPREVRQPEFEPGWMNIMVWRSRMLDNLRPPPYKELVLAWRSFFKSKLNSRVPLNATQALQCRRLFEYLIKPSEFPDVPKDYQLHSVDIAKPLEVLQTLRPRERTPAHLEFAQSLYASLGEVKEMSRYGSVDDIRRGYIMTICQYGGSQEAAEMLYKDWPEPARATEKGLKLKPLVLSVAQGLSREGLEDPLVSLVHFAEKNGIEFDADIQETVTEFFAERNRIPETMEWFEKRTASGNRSAKVYPTVATFAARNKLQNWAVPHFLKLGDTRPEKAYWDALLQSILITRRNLSQVEPIMTHMSHGGRIIPPDTASINALLRTAVELKQSSWAEEILDLAAERGLKMDGETYLRLMALRLDAKYLPGVQTAYKKVISLEPWQADPDLWWEFGRLLNQYLVTLSAQKVPDFKLMSQIIEQTEESQILLESSTVAALCIRYLENEQHFDVMDMLSVFTFKYSAAEREAIQDAFVSFCSNPETSTSRSWSGYQLLRQYFQDLSFDCRVKLIEVFFDRKRPDMASHVFGHMRQHRNSDFHPNLETYTMFFERLAQNPDLEALEMVHNMLKMDMKIEPNTKLYTSLMLAHAGCDKPNQAMEYWASITSSREGPSYSSLEAVFWALEKMPSGAQIAQQIWKKVERMDVEATPEVYDSLVGAIAASGQEQEVQNAIMRMSSVVSSEPSAMTLGIAHNALPGQKLQANFRKWAQMRFPSAWAELEKKGKRMTDESLCKFRLRRVIKA